MKKIKTMLALALMTYGLSSCVIYQNHTVTGNPIGSKKGTITDNNLNLKVDYSTKSAAKKGKISKIGSVDVKITSYILFTKYSTTVTGE